MFPRPQWMRIVLSTRTPDTTASRNLLLLRDAHHSLREHLVQLTPDHQRLLRHARLYQGALLTRLSDGSGRVARAAGTCSRCTRWRNGTDTHHQLHRRAPLRPALGRCVGCRISQRCLSPQSCSSSSLLGLSRWPFVAASACASALAWPVEVLSGRRATGRNCPWRSSQTCCCRESSASDTQTIGTSRRL